MGTIKQTNTRFLRSRRERDKEAENLREEIMTVNLITWSKETESKSRNPKKFQIR